ncbi:hypothetical protein RB598_006322 [Gaeumannomyces tritici]
MKQPTLPALAIAALSLGATLGLAAPPQHVRRNETAPAPVRTQPAVTTAVPTTVPTPAQRKPLGRPGGPDTVSIMGDEPKMPHDPATNPSCTWWYDNDGGLSCFDIMDIFGITGGQFAYWNPSVSTACDGMKVGSSYCVEGPAVPPGWTPPATTAAATTTTTSGRPTTTKPPGNGGIETPSPVQEGMVGNCNKFYFVPSGQSCGEVLSKNGLTIAQLFAWNSAVKSDCTGMWAEVYVCVGVVGGSPVTTPGPTTTKPGNSITTPTPTQPGMVNNCNKFFFVNSGESCSNVLSKNGVTIAQLFAWNSGVNSDCSGMWGNVYVCVGILGQQPPATTTTTTTKPPGNGIATPTPTQPGMVNNCNKFFLVNSGESCSNVLSKNGITIAQLFAWNSGVKSDCSGMWGNVYVCVGIIGQQPPTTTKPPGNGIATPTPTQPGMVNNCDKFYFVPTGEACSSVLSKNGISLTQFSAWNSGVKSDCSGMWGNVYQCVSIVGHEPPTGTNPGNGVSTPTPFQTGMVTNCKKFHKVAENQNCDTISKQYGISIANFIKWNPAAKSDCTGLWKDTYACVGLL